MVIGRSVAREQKKWSLLSRRFAVTSALIVVTMVILSLELRKSRYSQKTMKYYMLRFNQPIVMAYG